ncbi:MAG: hypothetical protein JOZ51_13125, partial [Chloroflexi bacterium]|nr:hypothetical protein [Chloroflexota bacterium]
PAWLSEIGVEDDRQPAETAQAPDWLTQLQQNPPESSSAEDLPAWLRSNDESPAAPPSAPAASQQLPDWLRDLESTPPPASPAEPMPSPPTPGWLQIDEPAAQAPAPPSTPPDQLPDWLRELETEAPTPAASAPAPADEIPAWLREDTPAQDQPSGTPSRPTELPDWLAEFGVADAPAAPAPSDPAPTAPAMPGALPEVPDWLSEFETTPPPAAATPPVDDVPAWLREESPAVEPTPNRAQTPELPDWLAGDTPIDSGAQDLNVPLPDWGSEFGADLPAQGAQNEPDMDWLRQPEPPNAQSGATIPLAPIAPTPPADDVPDWLREIEQPAASTPTAPSSDQDLPPWLAEESPTAAPIVPAPAQPTPTATDVPPWLLDTDTVAPIPSQSQSDDLPPWLADSGQPAASTQPFNDPGATQPLASWLLDEPSSGFGTTQPIAEQPAQPAQDFPSWLSSDDLASSSTTPSYTAADALPSWLAVDEPTSSAPAFSQPSDELPSWLAVDEPTSGAPAFNQASDELPVWLSAGPDDSSTTAPISSQSQSDELPPWLADDEPASTPSASYTAPQEDQLPSWLAAATDEPTITPSTGYTQPQADELPPWLAATDEPTISPVTAAQGDELPPWLAADEPMSTTAPINTQSQADDLPPWLAADEPSTAVDAGRISAQQPTPSQLTSADTVAFPTWLDDTAPAQPAPAETTSDSDLPPWLSGIEAEAPAKPAEPASALPSWLDEPAQPTKPTKQAAGQSEFLGGLDLPAWLREEGDAQQPAAPVKETAPDWLQKIAPETDEAVPVQQAAVVAQPRVTRTPERIESMRMLEQMLSEPAPEPAPAPVKRRRSWLPLLLGLILLLLVGAILFVLLNGRFGLSFGAGALPMPAAESAARTIDGLPTQRPVVLAYEWDAQRLGDLRPLEETLIVHLAARRDVPLVFVSTDPQGSLLAAERASQISSISDNFHDQYGLGYVNLGFKAGGPIALRQFAANQSFGALFAQDASGNDLRANDVVMQSVCGAATVDGCSWANVGLLVVMADEVEDVRGWFEQVRSQQPNLPVLLLTTAEIAPQVEPYVAAAGTQMLAGAAAAEAYSRARGVQDERLGRQTDAAAVGGALFALMIVVGGPIAVFQGYRTRREAEVEEWKQ